MLRGRNGFGAAGIRHHHDLVVHDAAIGMVAHTHTETLPKRTEIGKDVAFVALAHRSIRVEISAPLGKRICATPVSPAATACPISPSPRPASRFHPSGLRGRIAPHVVSLANELHGVSSVSFLVRAPAIEACFSSGVIDAHFALAASCWALYSACSAAVNGSTSRAAPSLRALELLLSLLLDGAGVTCARPRRMRHQGDDRNRGLPHSSLISYSTCNRTLSRHHARFVTLAFDVHAHAARQRRVHGLRDRDQHPARQAHEHLLRRLRLVEVAVLRDVAADRAAMAPAAMARRGPCRRRSGCRVRRPRHRQGSRPIPDRACSSLPLR